MIRLRALILPALASAMLTACASGPGAGHLQPPMPGARWSLQVEEGLDRIALAVHEAGLSANQHAALNALVGRFAHARSDVILIQAPAGGDRVAGEAAWGAHAALRSMGVPDDRIRMESYYAPHPRAPVLAGFTLVQAHVPQCGAAWENLSRLGPDRSSSNFGCAVNANLAAQVADPRDIIGPRPMTPADAARRAVVFENYRAGQATSAPQEELVRSRISQAVD